VAEAIRSGQVRLEGENVSSQYSGVEPVLTDF